MGKSVLAAGVDSLRTKLFVLDQLKLRGVQIDESQYASLISNLRKVSTRKHIPSTQIEPMREWIFKHDSPLPRALRDEIQNRWGGEWVDGAESDILTLITHKTQGT